MNIITKVNGAVKKRIRLFFNPYDKIFNNTRSKCYFIGIGGIGMSGLAHIMKSMGFRVSGSDMTRSALTDKLNDSDIKTYIGHDAKNLDEGTDIIIISSAIPKNNPEIEKALKFGIPIVKRSFVLGKIMNLKKGIAISGTHGKTTTTTMISLILENAGMDPVAMIGGEVKNIGGNYLAGRGEYFVAEACEYDRSFLDLYPRIAVITNIEADHLDYYRDIVEIKNAFKEFVRHLPKDGLLVISADDKNNLEVAKEAKCKVFAYGFGSKNRMQDDVIDEYWEVEDILQGDGETRFSLSEGKDLGEFILRIPGKHNVSDACAAIIVASYLGVDIKTIKEFLKTFEGTNRRFQIKGEKNGIIVVDDYAHHPTEIKSALEGARRFYKGKKIIAVFEPHQYSRTYLLKKEFGAAFGNADLVIIPDIYSVRDSEEDRKKITAADLVDEINSNGAEAIYVPGYDKVVEYLKKNTKKDSVIMTIGASNVYKIGEEYLRKS
ncbi:MAG TPA: UDP-N-acetylmuramate--L-alanine ligase [Patescibacteria group bacterium]|nr:UDP-N-acetylmuramate--L-alanine ligase [Patescibacteria group bacterium]